MKKIGILGYGNLGKKKKIGQQQQHEKSKPKNLLIEKENICVNAY